MARHQITTQQIVFPAINQIQVNTIQQTFSLDVDDVLLQTRYSLVSAGTELAKLTGQQKIDYPFIPGNRAVGEVIAVGDAVTDVQIGDLVFSHTPHVSHTLTQKLRIKVPENVDVKDSPLVGLALVGMTALRIGQVELGDRAVVIGAGLVGNLTAQLLQIAGVEVIVVDTNAGRLSNVQECGLATVVDASVDDPQTVVMDLTKGLGVDVVVEASGTAQGAALAVSLTGKSGEGIVVLLGSPRQDYETNLTPFLNQIHLWRNGSVSLRGAHEWRYPLEHSPFQKHSMARNAEIIFRLMAQNKLKTSPLITQIVRPDEAATAFAGLQHEPDAYMGILFDWTHS
ncbi:MAG: zinc-binding alcohol dehydrogenase [Chloroflexota bacterium]